LRESAHLPRSDSGFSALEVATAVAIIAILLVLALPVYSRLQARAQRVQCMANLRSLHTGTNMYLQEHDSWPQINLASDAEPAVREYTDAWLAALKPFGVLEKTWICPTVQALLRDRNDARGSQARLDYVPTAFDDRPMAPRQWPRHPWFVEVGDVHGNGNLIIFTDGSIADLKSIIAEQPVAR
jgi:prepilin-type N-terminal cleavage/methylation domain-containing protein